MTLNGCTAAIENSPYTPDPYRNVAAPTVPLACATNGELGQLLTNPHQTRSPKASSDPTFNKAYCGGGNIQGTTNLSAGVYVLSGGNWKVNSGAELNGGNVTLYLTNGATLDINGGATIDMSAPLSGPYAGLLVFFDRTNTGSSKINGGSNFSMVGAIYGAKQNIEFTGNTTGSGPGECTQVIGYTVSMTGNSDFDTDCSNSGTTQILAGQSIKVVG